MAAAVCQDPDAALRVHTREELGVDPAGLPSAILAGAASLAAFSLGALIRCCPTWPACPPWPQPWLLPPWPCSPAGSPWAGSPAGRYCGPGPRRLALGAVAIGITFTAGSLIGHHGT
jgi:vacuolar iron transporter family protein